MDNVIQPAVGYTAPKKKVASKKKSAKKVRALRARATAQTPQQKAETPLQTSAQRRDAAHANTARPERIPTGANYEKLGAIARPYRRDGYVLRMVSDRPGRLAQMLSGYWVFVTDDSGNNVVYQKGMRVMHLMELPLHLFEEDKRMKDAKNNATIEKDATIDPGQYVPAGKVGPLSVDSTDYTD